MICLGIKIKAQDTVKHVWVSSLDVNSKKREKHKMFSGVKQSEM